MTQRVDVKAEGRKIYFRLSDEDFDIFRLGRTRGELFLPLNAKYVDLLFDGSKMRNEIRDWCIEVAHMQPLDPATKALRDYFANLKATDVSVRTFPIRVSEPKKKHIVLRTDLLTKNIDRWN